LIVWRILDSNINDHPDLSVLHLTNGNIEVIPFSILVETPQRKPFRIACDLLAIGSEKTWLLRIMFSVTYQRRGFKIEAHIEQHHDHVDAIEFSINDLPGNNLVEISYSFQWRVNAKPRTKASLVHRLSLTKIIQRSEMEMDYKMFSFPLSILPGKSGLEDKSIKAYPMNSQNSRTEPLLKYIYRPINIAEPLMIVLDNQHAFRGKLF
jgi:hypothetical protein